ncbi:MAG: manganese efflux pump [Ruminococcaceae bacterium]|nr:manganese efflux pump [Oscillospiraceae bacterium]
MSWNFMFFFNSALLGVGLAMDAFSVSLANGLHEPKMSHKKTALIAGTFAFFQFLMPMVGWLLVHTLVQCFKQFQVCVPWIALLLLGFIGGKMLIDSIRGGEEEEAPAVGIAALLVQGIATSIDALSVGCTISDYGFLMAFVCCLIIAIVTFAICVAGLYIGKSFGTRLAGKAGILGGVILILIGLEIFITGVFF